MTAIGGREIGYGQPCYVVAEIGGNHDGNLNQAKRMIRVAADCGADAAKFQFYGEMELYPGVSTPGAIPDWWLGELADEAERAGIGFFCSVFSLETLTAYLVTHPPLAIKIASPEATNTELLRAAGDTRLPVIVSTGACTLTQVFDIRFNVGPNLILLQCVSAYPARAEDMNLATIQRMMEACRVPVGLSDHTTQRIVPELAVAAGACMIEKHLTLDRRSLGPDHSFALEPADFKATVKAIRCVERIMGDGVKQPAASEDVTDRRAA